jgi:hypothetical protein
MDIAPAGLPNPAARAADIAIRREHLFINFKLTDH